MQASGEALAAAEGGECVGVVASARAGAAADGADTAQDRAEAAEPLAGHGVLCMEGGGAQAEEGGGDM